MCKNCYYSSLDLKKKIGMSLFYVISILFRYIMLEYCVKRMPRLDDVLGKYRNVIDYM